MTTAWSDQDPVETSEWLDALASLIQYEGKERAEFIINQLLKSAEAKGLQTGGGQIQTPYINTIPVDQQPPYPGDLRLEAAIEALVRWNAVAMVIKAKQKAGGVGGHLSSFASIAILYEVGMNHFFRGQTKDKLGDLVYFQGHSSEGNYARAYLEGRLTDTQLTNFRQEVEKDGLSSYPHPWLMPDFWQFATVSLGLGMLQGIYQARFLKYLDHRGLLPANDRKVWVFCGDGEMDEVDAIGALSVASREKLDNLIFVVNCNLQRLDGLVRSNGKVVQELEGIFRGAGWHVIKVMWGSEWDALFAKDKTGALVKRLTDCVDGDLQTAYVRGPAYMREFLFNIDELKATFADVTEEQIAGLKRGAHDPVKVYAAYAAATAHQHQPTVILAQGVKGYGLGTNNAEGRNIAHNQLDMSLDDLKAFRDRFSIPVSDKELVDLTFKGFKKNDEAATYLKERRETLTGYLPSRLALSNPLKVPALSDFDSILQGSGDRTQSTTMAFGRILNVMLKDKNIADRIVPIFSDEVRTFGLEALFRQVGIYSSVGQLYTPEDKEQFLFYKEETKGQVLEEGITEAGCMASWIAAATSYSTHHLPMIPFFTYYSMFGFQRVGDMIWAASDMRARGFLIGATAGRTTLEGEGLQHQDGSSLLTASTVPTCRAYDPTYAYEMAVILQHGLKEMYAEEKDVIYYVMAMNERYIHPPMPKGVEDDIIKGMYLFQDGGKSKQKVQLLGSGAILNEVIAAAELLKKDFEIAADVWSVTSFGELRRDGMQIEREKLFAPGKKHATPFVMQQLKDHPGPIVAATDYVHAYADLIRPYIDRTYITLGTDGFGRSDTREALRHYFEVDRYHIVLAALGALHQEGQIEVKAINAAMKKYQINPDKSNPVTG